MDDLKSRLTVVIVALEEILKSLEPKENSYLVITHPIVVKALTEEKALAIAKDMLKGIADVAYVEPHIIAERKIYHH
jgi:hypothetical protein